MRRLLYLAALTLVASLVLTPASLAQSRGPSGADGSYNCEDFDTQAQAQAFYDAQGGVAGGDPDLLDIQGDGSACEMLPSDNRTELNDLDCVDFTLDTARVDVQIEAQATYDADTSDPNGLDADGDGIACESTTSVASGTEFEDGSGFIDGTSAGTETASPVAEETPVATPEPTAEPTSATTLPETGGPGGAALLLLPAAGLFLATGLVGLRMVRRHS